MFNDPDLVRQLKELMNLGRVKSFYNLVHRKIMENPQQIFEDDGTDLDYKRMQVVTTLEYFIGEEQYEKAGDFKKLLKMIDDYKINNNGATV
jgi:hypothetical protein